MTWKWAAHIDLKCIPFAGWAKEGDILVGPIQRSTDICSCCEHLLSKQERLGYGVM